MRLLCLLFSLSFACVAIANTPYNQINTEKSGANKLDIQTLALQKQYLQTIDCRGVNQLTSLLEKSLEQTADLSAKGNNASVFEEVMMNNPSCFIQAANALPVKACDEVEAQFIHETFFYPRAEIKEALSGAQNYQSSCLAS